MIAHIEDVLKDRVLLCDGGFGSRVQALTLDLDRDYWGQENCTEILNLSRPDLVRDIHKGYLAAGSDCVQTNSFGGSPITLAEFGLSPRAFEINKRAAELAREAAEFVPVVAYGGAPFVLGSIGPGTRLPSLGHLDYASIEAALTVQAEGLAAGGVDAFLIETCQDPLQIKAAINGAKRARHTHKRDHVPIFVQVTVETTGTLLVGSDIAAAATIVEAMDAALIGLNCATGPSEMAQHLRWLSENWPGLISCQPNAGLPELVDGKAHYPLGPDELALWLKRFIAEEGLNLIGGCCGTDQRHIGALDKMLRGLGDGARPRPKARKPAWIPSIASLYSQVPLRQEQAFLSIGERCNANGSKQWRTLQEAHDWDGCLAMARAQINEGSHALDICMAFTGRDEKSEMETIVSRFCGTVTAPLVIDSTEYPVLESVLALYGGKAVINSINFEDGPAPVHKRLGLAKKFGAAVIALTIDEEGMAKTPERKLAIAKRLYDIAVKEHGLRPADLLFDPLTFTIATGQEDDRKLGLWTLDGIELIAKAMPECQIVLGLSNISFGLNPASRQVLNSVFLDHAIKRGMTGAIVHVSKIVPLHKIAPEEVKAAEDLIFDRRVPGGPDPLHVFIGLFEGRAAANERKAKERPATLEGVLKQRIIEGDRTGLDEDLTTALKTYPPLDIINTILLDGMKMVGELFGSGKMQLPFVLQSAETMKAAVAYLEPHMERVAGAERGTIVLATVKGDVHDIGKNLVDIILTNNGYKVVNLGIKQPIEAIAAAAEAHTAHAIGMSGLLVKSTVVMRENLEALSGRGFKMPILLGGAALTRAYVEEDCVKAYAGGRVAYASDAFDGLRLMDRVVGGTFDDYVSVMQAKRQAKGSNRKRRLGEATTAAPLDAEEARKRRLAGAESLPIVTPPFWGARRIEEVRLKALLPYLNERMLYQMQWGFAKQGKSLDEFMAWAKDELRPVLHKLVAQAHADKTLAPQAAYGYWPAAGEGESIVLYDPADPAREVARFALPRQAEGERLSIADFVRDASLGPDQRDVIGLQVVTMGRQATEAAQKLFAADRYQEYLYFHGLSVEMTEAMAEYVHKRIRAELGFVAEDSREMDDLLQQGYRGSRYSFGYPACPNLEDQVPLLKLLEAERLGITLSDEYQLDPEQSTSAIVLHHPKARYFSI